MVTLTTMYASIWSHRSDCNNDVLNLISLLGLYLLLVFFLCKQPSYWEFNVQNSLKVQKVLFQDLT